MQEPRKPYKPNPPKEPELMVSYLETVWQEQIFDGQCLSTVLEGISRRSGYTIEDVIKNSGFNFVTCEYDGDDIYLDLNIYKKF